MVSLETDRLLLRMLQESDFDSYAEICADPEVMRYLGDGQPLSRPMAWRHMAMMVGHWHLRGYGLWAAEERASGAPWSAASAVGIPRAGLDSRSAGCCGAPFGAAGMPRKGLELLFSSPFRNCSNRT